MSSKEPVAACATNWAHIKNFITRIRFQNQLFFTEVTLVSALLRMFEPSCLVAFRGMKEG
jgi:hypothetical protein